MNKPASTIDTSEGRKGTVDAKAHVPVLLQEVLEILKPQQGELFIDATFGAGGHSEKILERIGVSGKLIVIDWDWSALRYVPKGENIIPINENFACVADVIKSLALPKADGLLLDLGLSSEQLDESGRGFTFKRAEPLLMTYDSFRTPMREILKTLREEELADILERLSGERYARQIAHAIIAQEKKHPITNSLELAEIVQSAVPQGYERGRIDPATRTFMALRIFANKELENLEKVLTNLPRIVKRGGRVAIIAFHSGEDRMVKQYFQRYEREGIIRQVTKKPIVATREEIQKNSRARSAKLRGAIIQ